MRIPRFEPRPSQWSTVKRFASYVWPITKKVPSDLNGIMEITYINGKKVLDSKNANYSYGNLQRILEIGLSKTDLSDVTSILLLGLGGGSVVASLLGRFQYTGTLVGVEWDAKMIAIAEKEFSISSNEQLTILHDDAYTFTLKDTNAYDLVIVDLFVDTQVPKQFYSKEFCDGLRQRTGKGGKILFNLGLDAIRSEESERVIGYFKEHPYFTYRLMEHVEGYNLILLATRIDSNENQFHIPEIPTKHTYM